jgi:hypothetical protein
VRRAVASRFHPRNDRDQLPTTALRASSAMGTPIRSMWTTMLSAIHSGFLDPGPAAERHDHIVHDSTASSLETGLAENSRGNRLQNARERHAGLQRREDPGTDDGECPCDESTSQHRHGEARPIGWWRSSFHYHPPCESWGVALRGWVAARRVKKGCRLADGPYTPASRSRISHARASPFTQRTRSRRMGKWGNGERGKL